METMMTIGDLADATGASRRSLRYYEEQGLLHPVRASNGYRSYPGSAVEQVRQIRSLLDSGLSTEVIRCALPCLDGTDIDVSAEPDGPMANRLRQELANIEEKIEVLSHHRDRILRFLAPPRPPHSSPHSPPVENQPTRVRPTPQNDS